MASMQVPRTAGAALLRCRVRSSAGLRCRARNNHGLLGSFSEASGSGSISGTCPRTGTSAHDVASFSSSAHDNINNNDDNDDQRAKRVWRSASSSEGETTVPSSWSSPIDDQSKGDLRAVLDRIGEQERESGRMKQNHQGVFRADPAEDMRLMIENYTVPALASALRDREDTLQECAALMARGQLKDLADVLRPYEAKYVQMRRRRENLLDMRQNGFGDTTILERLRRSLMKMPRRVSSAFERRAAVVLPLCNVNGVPAVLFEKRARHLRAHPDEVCLPGGMVSVGDDKSIVGTCLREMEEEIGGMEHDEITVLGVLRCNWGEVHHLTGVAVTPVVCYIGEISHLDLQPSADEVAEVFTVPLSSFLDRSRWVKRENFAPIFVGGPHVIWGLTGYILDRFMKDVLARYTIELPSTDNDYP